MLDLSVNPGRVEASADTEEDAFLFNERTADCEDEDEEEEEDDDDDDRINASEISSNPPLFLLFLDIIAS